MTFISDAIEAALTRLTKQLLEHQTHQANSLICVKGEFYRAKLRLERIAPSDVADYLSD